MPFNPEKLKESWELLLKHCSSTDPNVVITIPDASESVSLIACLSRTPQQASSSELDEKFDCQLRERELLIFIKNGNVWEMSITVDAQIEGIGGSVTFKDCDSNLYLDHFVLQPATPSLWKTAYGFQPIRLPLEIEGDPTQIRLRVEACVSSGDLEKANSQFEAARGRRKFPRLRTNSNLLRTDVLI